jgi:hypothetical protein
MSLIVRNTQICNAFLCGQPVSAKGLCHKHYHAKYRDDNRPRINEARREYVKEKREQVLTYNHFEGRATKYQKFYNITISDYDRIRAFMADHPKFKFLLNKPTATMREAVEHRHGDGLIRGVMASMLNRAYGLIERLYGPDTADVLEALAEFHRNPPAELALGEKVYGLIGKAQRKKEMLYGPDGSKTPRPR